MCARFALDEPGRARAPSGRPRLRSIAPVGPKSVGYPGERMKTAALAFVAAFLLSGGFAPAAQADDGLNWMSGCWQTADRSYREVWSKPESGFLFGYSITHDAAGAVTFFEQARIDGGRPAVFSAYPGGAGPSAFAEVSRAQHTVTFEDGAHDYPQRIVYTRSGRRMNATISLLNGDRAVTWAFRRC